LAEGGVCGQKGQYRISGKDKAANINSLGVRVTGGSEEKSEQVNGLRGKVIGTETGTSHPLMKDKRVREVIEVKVFRKEKPVRLGIVTHPERMVFGSPQWIDPMTETAKPRGVDAPHEAQGPRPPSIHRRWRGIHIVASPLAASQGEEVDV
jgi:hypothetical protein